jgi:hypothetical protein
VVLSVEPQTSTVASRVPDRSCRTFSLLLSAANEAVLTVRVRHSGDSFVFHMPRDLRWWKGGMSEMGMVSPLSQHFGRIEHNRSQALSSSNMDER